MVVLGWFDVGNLGKNWDMHLGNWKLWHQSTYPFPFEGAKKLRC